MPTTRRSAGRPTASGSNKQQSTLSFNHRVTKPVPQSAKGTTKNIIGTTTPAKKQSPLGKHVLKVEDEEPVDVEAEEEEEEEQETKREAEEEKKSEAELRALKVTDRQIDQYWRGLERERTARRVHQRELSLAEKVLRYWDVSSQYGPCVGISRMKRWQRADRLGLNPPVEVLAVLVKEEGKGTKGIERAHMDEILNSTPSVDVE